MNTSALAKILDVSPKTIRRWIQLFDMQLTKNENGHYVFNDDDVKTFSDIKEKIRNGITTKEIMQNMKHDPEKMPAKVPESESSNRIEERFNEIFQQLKAQEKKINAKADEVVSYQILVHRKEIDELQSKIQQLEQKLNHIEMKQSKETNDDTGLNQERKKRKGLIRTVLG